MTLVLAIDFSKKLSLKKMYIDMFVIVVTVVT